MKWDVHRDQEGSPVLLTEEQCRAVRQAARVWFDVPDAATARRRREGPRPASTLESVREAAAALDGAMISKSCLMGRMLCAVRPPLPEPPPVVSAAPAYWLVEGRG